jgi:FAD/FMN-containing dehydrogenase
MQAQHGAGLDVLRRIQKSLDPNGVMNPGKLGL